VLDAHERPLLNTGHVLADEVQFESLVERDADVALFLCVRHGEARAVTRCCLCGY